MNPRVIAALTAVLCVTACTTTTSGTARGRSTSPRSSGFPSTPTASVSPAAGCATTYAAPDPHRPVVRLAFTVAPDLTSATGTEHIVFTPDRPITELVFRLTANTAPTAAQGNKVVVTAATADHGAGAATYSRSGAAASTQGGLLHIPFASPIPAGTTVTADLAFRVAIGANSFDRFGRSDVPAGRFAWFASAQPLLAWERGFGWHKEDLISFTAESATSEAMDTDLTVTAPAADTVVMSGDGSPSPSNGATRTWHSTIATARDVSVAVGPFAVSNTVVDGTKLQVAAYSKSIGDALVPEFTRAITQLSARFGPFPFPSLSVARVPSEGGGIEYPSSILMLDGSRLVAVHETAHQWFYAMVGDSQALHPWLDEAFAQYAEMLVNGEAPDPKALSTPGAVDRSTESYGQDESGYYYITYSKGSAALLAARTAAGPAKFDSAMRCYINANAWRIADPSDFAAALKALPAAVAVLTKAGAFP